MVKCYRKAWTIPDRVFDILARFEPEVELDVIHAIRSYSKFWDENGCDDGFSYDFSYDGAKGVFYSVFDELQSYNQQYFEKCKVMTENALAGVAKRKAKSVTRKRQKMYYEKHREAINSKRREDYAGKAKNEKCKAKSDKSVKRKALYESTQSQGGQATAGNSAKAHRIIGLNKLSSLHSDSLLGKREYEGEGPNYAQKGMERPQDNNRTNSLSCSKAVATGCASPIASKAVSGNRIAGSEGSKGSVAIGTAGIKDRGSCGSDKAVNELGKRLCAEGGLAAKNRLPELLSAPHLPKTGEELITKDWRINLADEVFYPYRRMDPFLKQGVETWMKDNKLGCSVEKRWICRQIVNFATRQGKLQMLMGVDDDGICDE